jgi:phasin family protein
VIQPYGGILKNLSTRKLDNGFAALHISHVALQQNAGFRSAHTNDEVMDMAKAKLAGEKINGTETIEAAMKNGSEALKTGFEKVAKNYDHFVGYGRETVEAYMKAANVAGKGVETLQSEIYTFSKQSVEESIAATKALMGTKSIHEAFELQTDFAKSAFDSYVGQMTKLSEIVFSTAKDAFEPLQGRVQAWVEVVESSRAA